jgi:hypothetical protein
MTLAEGTPNEIDWLMEQLDACHDLAHKYNCAFCRKRQGKEPVLVVQDQPEGGVRIRIVVACRDCLPDVKKAGEVDAKHTKH